MFRQTFVWTPLQRFYLSAYTRSAVASSLGIRTGRYRVLLMENRRGSRLAIDDEVVPIALSTGETTFALSVEIRWDSGQMSSFDAGDRRHLDYGYALTSHCSQGQTAGRVLVHVETASASEKLVNQRLAYVAVSRGQHDARIYTDDKVGLARALRREVSHRSALERTPVQPSREIPDREISRTELVGHTVAVGRS